MNITTEQLRAAYLRSGNVYAGSEKLGRIGQIYLDDETSEPTWVTVKTGLFGTSESFVPLNSARLEGDDILVDHDKDTIKNAPRIDADGDLTPREELALFRYYSRPRAADSTDWEDRTDRDDDRLNRDDDLRDRDDDLRDRDTAQDHQRVVDEVADRREENRSERGRLRRYVVTEITEDR
jgi:PRC-barrel domain